MTLTQWLILIGGVLGLIAIAVYKSGWRPKKATVTSSAAATTTGNKSEGWWKKNFGTVIMIILVAYGAWAMYIHGDRIVKSTDSTRALANAIAEANQMKKDVGKLYVDTMIILASTTGSEMIEIPEGSKVRFSRMENVSFALRYETERGKVDTLEFFKNVDGLISVPPNMRKIEFFSLEDEPVIIIFMSTKPIDKNRVGPHESPRIIAGAVTYLFWLFRYCGLDSPKVFKTIRIRP